MLFLHFICFTTYYRENDLTKLSTLPLQDNILSWFVKYFINHSHVTKYDGQFSSSAAINAGVFQGSALGPSMFVINGLDLKPLIPGNFLDKYADDTYLLSPAGNDSSVALELQNIETWANENNLKLNINKSQEMIIVRNERSKTTLCTPAPITAIQRVDSIKILGVTLTSSLSIKEHVNNVCASAAQGLYAVKLLKAHGLDPHSASTVCQSLVISRLTYAAPAWWGLTRADDKQKLQAVINRAIKWGLLSRSHATLDEICHQRDLKLFSAVLSNPSHVLHSLLPEEKPNFYNLRPRSHNRVLPQKDLALTEKNFFCRMLYDNAF